MGNNFIKGTFWNPLKKYALPIKFAVTLIVLTFIYLQLKGKADFFDNLSKIILEFRTDIKKRNLMVLVVIMMPLNWMIESKKWHYLTSKFCSISFLNALKGTLSGLSFGIISPNRTGEFAGRVLFIPNKFRIRGVVASLLISWSQLLIMLIVGIIALLVVVFLKFNMIILVYFL